MGGMASSNPTVVVLALILVALTRRTVATNVLAVGKVLVDVISTLRPNRARERIVKLLEEQTNDLVRTLNPTKNSDIDDAGPTADRPAPVPLTKDRPTIGEPGPAPPELPPPA